MEQTLEEFVGHFLKRGMNWFTVPPTGSYDFGDVICVTLYRKPPFQVEMVVIPKLTKIVPHHHPDVDSYELHLCGDINLMINGTPAFTEEQVADWRAGKLSARPVHIGPTDEHWGDLRRGPMIFLSMQKWKDGVEPTSVGINWDGKPSHPEQSRAWQETGNPYGKM